MKAKSESNYKSNSKQYIKQELKFIRMIQGKKVINGLYVKIVRLVQHFTFVILKNVSHALL